MKNKETKEQYFCRVKDLLTEFWKKNTRYPEDNPIEKWALEKYEVEHNFVGMSLEIYCDVKYFIQPGGLGDKPAGILCTAHRIEDRRPMVNFLKNKWTEFQYQK